MTIQTFDRKTCREVSDEALAALQTVAAKYGLVLESEAGRFSTDSFTAKFTFTVVAGTTATGLAVPADFSRKAAMVGLPTDCFGKTFTTFSGKTFRVAGINLKATAYPVLATEVGSGKTFKMPVAQVVFGLRSAA